MTTLTSFQVTDDLTDNLASYHNRLLGSILRSEFKNAETLSTTRTLLDDDTPIQRLNCNGANRIVKMPTANTTVNHPYLIVNSTSSGTYTLEVQSNDGNTKHIILGPNQAAFLVPDGNGEYIATLMSEKTNNVSLAIDGLGLVWNSATSLSVGTGGCYNEAGDFINVTSTLTASSLSLSSSTWYHVYVYLSSGSPAMEVVTTAPVAWKGSAYSKTGDTSRRYVGSVRTDGSGNVYKFYHNPADNLIMYADLDPSASPFLVLNAGTASSSTSVSLTSCVPVTAAFCVIRAFNSGDKTFRVGATIASSTQFGFVLAAGSSVSTYSVQTLPCPSQTIYYKFDSAVGVGSASIWNFGYLFKR